MPPQEVLWHLRGAYRVVGNGPDVHRPPVIVSAARGKAAAQPSALRDGGPRIQQSQRPGMFAGFSRAMGMVAVPCAPVCEPATHRDTIMPCDETVSQTGLRGRGRIGLMGAGWKWPGQL